MPKKFILSLITLFTALALCACQNAPLTNAKLFYIDVEMLRLIPIEISISDSDPQTEAQTIINELIRGRDSNPKIRRLIPQDSRALSVTVDNRCACVNVKTACFADVHMNRDLEYLFVYQIVNSLTALDDIDAVIFTVDGKTQKRFKGFVDMRELFVADYFM